MADLRKFFFHNDVHFITCSVEQGIMLPANDLIIKLVKSAFLRAQNLYPVVLSHLIVNGTHIHMIVRVDDPEHIPKFMERFKTESAHYLNRVLNRSRRTVWCDDYDSPRLLTVQDVIDKLVYLYCNPVKDGLIDSIDNYPGLSSWNLYQNRQKRIYAKKISRNDVFPVSQDLDAKGYKKAARRIYNSSSTRKLQQLILKPDDWMRAFGITEDEQKRSINERVFKLIRMYEANCQAETNSFMGREKLENQGIELSYVSSREPGRKMWCISSDKDKRKSYIQYLKKIAARAEAVYAEWKRGNTSLRMPLGVFAPRMPVVANLIA